MFGISDMKETPDNKKALSFLCMIVYRLKYKLQMLADIDTLQ